MKKIQISEFCFNWWCNINNLTFCNINNSHLFCKNINDFTFTVNALNLCHYFVVVNIYYKSQGFTFYTQVHHGQVSLQKLKKKHWMPMDLKPRKIPIQSIKWLLKPCFSHNLRLVSHSSTSPLQMTSHMKNTIAEFQIYYKYILQHLYIQQIHIWGIVMDMNFPW